MEKTRLSDLCWQCPSQECASSNYSLSENMSDTTVFAQKLSFWRLCIYQYKKGKKGGQSKVGNPHQIFTHSEVNQIKEWFPKNCKLAFLFSKYNNMWSKKCAHPTPPRTPPPENLYLRAAGYQTRPHLRWQLTVQNLTWHFMVNKYLTKSQFWEWVLDCFHYFSFFRHGAQTLYDPI